jgi:hypothetical protein
MGGIGSFLENIVGGDKNIGKHLREYVRAGEANFGYGRGLTEEALGGIRQDAAGYEERLRSGSVLSKNVRNALDTARGRVSDQSVRNMTALKSRLQASRAASGGRISESALQQLQGDGDELSARSAGVGAGGDSRDWSG